MIVGVEGEHADASSSMSRCQNHHRSKKIKLDSREREMIEEADKESERETNR